MKGLIAIRWVLPGSHVSGQVASGEGRPLGDQVGRGALEDHPASVLAGARTEVDDPVGVGYHRLVVLDHDDRLARVHQPVEQCQQMVDVGQVEPAGRLVEHVDPALVGHVDGQLEALALAAGEGGQLLADAEVAETDPGEPVEDAICAAGTLESPPAKKSLASMTGMARTSLMSFPASR